MNSLVSIITPTYNHEKFIAECIESVLAQTYPHWEMIIIDDASTDKTPYIVEEYAKKDERIKFIRHQKNWGIYRLADTYNQALELSKGDYIAILEGDDFWPKNKLETQICYFTIEKESILSHGLVAIVNNRRVKICRYLWKSNIRENIPTGSILKAFLFGENPIFAVTVMLKREWLEKIGGFYPKDMQLTLVDYPTWMELSLYGKFVFIPKIIGFYRKHNFSITSLYPETMWREKIKYLSLYVEKHKNEILGMLGRRYLQNYGCNAFIEVSRLKLLKSQKKEAREFLYEAWRRKRVLPRIERAIKWIILWFSAYGVNIYKFLFNLKNLLKTLNLVILIL
jgi:glycosyltransferase involved in cell wall biosynthesis